MSDVSSLKDRENVKKTVLVVDYVNESWKDGHWGWIVCLAAAVVQFVVLGIHNSFGILYIVFVREYGWSKALTGKLVKFLLLQSVLQWKQALVISRLSRITLFWLLNTFLLRKAQIVLRNENGTPWRSHYLGLEIPSSLPVGNAQSIYISFLSHWSALVTVSFLEEHVPTDENSTPSVDEFLHPIKWNKPRVIQNRTPGPRESHSSYKVFDNSRHNYEYLGLQLIFQSLQLGIGNRARLLFTLIKRKSRR